MNEAYRENYEHEGIMDARFTLWEEKGNLPSPRERSASRIRIVNPKHRCPLFSNSEMSPFGFVRFP